MNDLIPPPVESVNQVLSLILGASTVLSLVAYSFSLKAKNRLLSGICLLITLVNGTGIFISLSQGPHRTHLVSTLAFFTLLGLFRLMTRFER